MDDDRSIANVIRLETGKLKCPGIGRDKDNTCALQFYFSRRVTDDEMRFLHEVMQRSVAMFPLEPRQ